MPALQPDMLISDHSGDPFPKGDLTLDLRVYLGDSVESGVRSHTVTDFLCERA